MPASFQTADNRVKLANMKTSYFQVQIQSGSCDNLGSVMVSQYCRGCTNSLGVALAGKDGRVSFFFIEHFLQGDRVYKPSLFKGDGFYTPSLFYGDGVPFHDPPEKLEAFLLKS